MTRLEAKQITMQTFDYAKGIALQMIDEFPATELPRLSPTSILKFALDETEKIMQYRRDYNKPHPSEKRTELRK